MKSIHHLSRELWFNGPFQVEIRSVPLPSLGSGQVLVSGLASAVSHGTERLLFCGEGPEPFDASLGHQTFPLRYGYAWVGDVQAVGHGCDLGVGSRVFALAPHGDAHVLDATACRQIPLDMPPIHGCLAAFGETAVNAIWDSQMALGDRIVVLGAGMLGVMIVALAKQSGARDIIVVDRSPHRLELAKQFGASEVLNELESHIRADVVFEVTGHPQMLNQAVLCAGFESKIVVVSFYGNRTAPIALGDFFHRRRLQLVSSQVSALPLAQRSRWDTQRRFDLVLDLLKALPLNALLAPPTPLSDAPQMYARLADNDPDMLQQWFTYEENISA